MSVNTATAQWNGSFKEGSGQLSVGSGAFSGDYSYRSRMENAPAQTNPEELIGVALAGCFTMALSAKLGVKNHVPESLHTQATVTLEQNDKQLSITTIDLVTSAKVPGIGEEEFQAIVKDAKENCPVSKALAGVSITVKASLAA